MTSRASRELAPGWAWATIADIGLVQGGIQKQPKRAPRDNAFPFLRVANVLRGRLDLQEIHRIELFGDEFRRLRLEAGDLLIVEGNGSPSEIGRMAVWRGVIPDCVHQNHIIRVRPASGISSEFIEAFWNSPKGRDAIREVASSTSGLYTLSVAKVGRLSVPLAPLPEQRRIVAAIETHFTRLDSAVAALQRARANLKRFRAAVLKAAVEGRLVPTEAELARAEGREYEPAATLLVRILDEHRAGWRANESTRRPLVGKRLTGEPRLFDDLSSIGHPEGWASVKLGAMLREPLRNGHSAKASAAGSGGVRTLTLSAVTNGEFSEANTKLTVAKPEHVTDLWLESGDIFIERSNTPELVGTAARYKGAYSFAIFPDLLIRVRLVPSVSDRYVELFLQSEQARSYFRQRAQGIAGSMPKVDQAAVANLAVPLPPRAEQERIASEAELRLSVLKDLEFAIEHALKRAERLRQAILKRAFEGKLVPQDPTDEPASVLLERIRAERTAGGAGITRGARRGRRPGNAQAALPGL